MAKAGPRPILGSFRQSTTHRIAVHIPEFLNRLFVVPHVEVVVPSLPESNVSRPLELSRYLLFQHLEDDREWHRARLAYQQMGMFRHHNISGDDEAVALPHLLQFFFEDAVPGSGCEQRLSPIATESEEVKVTSMLIANQTSGHD